MAKETNYEQKRLRNRKYYLLHRKQILNRQKIYYLAHREEILKQAQVSCGKDWKQFLKHDSKEPLFYLDPPYMNNKTSDKYYKFKDVSLKEVLDKTKKLKGTVILSYSPKQRKEICNEKTRFKCKTLSSWSFANPSKELLAIKK